MKIVRSNKNFTVVNERNSEKRQSHKRNKASATEDRDNIKWKDEKTNENVIPFSKVRMKVLGRL